MIQTSPMQYSIGVLIELQIVDSNNAVVDLSAATALRIYVEKPSSRRDAETDEYGDKELGTISYWTASLSTDGKDGKLRYITTSEDDLDEYGKYRIQAYAEIAGKKYPSSVTQFRVLRGIVDTSAVEIVVPAAAEESTMASPNKQCLAVVTTGTGNPTVLEPYNDIPGTINWTRTGVGVTRATHSDHGFPLDGRTLVIPVGYNLIKEIKQIDDQTIDITTDDDGDLVNRQILITVYPQI